MPSVTSPFSQLSLGADALIVEAGDDSVVLKHRHRMIVHSIFNCSCQRGLMSCEVGAQLIHFRLEFRQQRICVLLHAAFCLGHGLLGVTNCSRNFACRSAWSGYAFQLLHFLERRFWGASDLTIRRS